MASALIHLALLIGGLVAALTLRRRDTRAALLTACGFGCMLLGLFVGMGWGFVAAGVVGRTQMETIILVVNLVTTIIRLAGFLLILLGLLRMLRRNVSVASGMGEAR